MLGRLVAVGALWVALAAIGAAPAGAASVSVSPEPVHGTVTDDWAQINCGDGGDDCHGSYAVPAEDVEVVTLTATPSAGYSFESWTGCGLGSDGNTCQLVLRSTDSRTVTATFEDTTPPTVTLTSPGDGSLYGPGQTIPLGASAADGTGIVSRVEFLLTKPGSSSVTVVDSSAPYAASVSADSLTDGTWTVVARAFDGAGNWADSVPRSFAVDKVAPSVSVTGPGEFTASNPQVTSFAASADAVAARCYVDGGSAVSCTSATTHETAFDGGTHTVGVQVRDAAGNWSAVQSATFTVDTATPAVAIASPVEGAVTNAASVAAQFSVTDASPVTVSCRLDGQAPAPCDSPTSHTFPSPPEGTRTITVRAVDAAGNAAEATRSFVADRTGPAVTITGPAEGATVASDPVAVTYALSDATGVAARECRFGDAAFVACSETRYEQAGLPGGPVTFEIRATDRAGNVTLVRRSFTVSRGTDEGGDTSTGGTVASTVKARWKARKRHTVFRRLRVTGIPVGATLQLHCRTKDRGCPFKKRSLTPAGSTATLTHLVRRRKLKVRAVLEVRVLKPGAVGQVTRYKVRRNRAPRATTLCLPPGASKPTTC